MHSPQKQSWINLAELKDQLTKKLGPEKSKQYFDYLKRFLSLKLSKLEFDKLCLRTVGKDNIPLHNQLIRSILKNACTRKASPPPTADDHSTTFGKKTEALHRKSGKEASSRTQLIAPIGIPYRSVIKASSSVRNSKSFGVFDNGDLIETTELRERMEQLAVPQGVQQVSMDSARVLNNGLEAYLKRLIRSFSELTGSRSGPNPIKNSLRPVNGVRPGHHYQIHEPKSPISLLDFTVSMNLNPQQLGKDWPMLLEKISTHVSRTER